MHISDVRVALGSVWVRKMYLMPKCFKTVFIWVFFNSDPLPERQTIASSSSGQYT